MEKETLEFLVTSSSLSSMFTLIYFGQRFGKKIIENRFIPYLKSLEKISFDQGVISVKPGWNALSAGRIKNTIYSLRNYFKRDKVISVKPNY